MRQYSKVGIRSRRTVPVLPKRLDFVFFLWLPLWYMEVPRLGVEWETQLPAYITTTATQDSSSVCDLHHSSWQSQLLNPLSEARNQTSILMDTSQIHFRWAWWELPWRAPFKKHLKHYGEDYILNSEKFSCKSKDLGRMSMGFMKEDGWIWLLMECLLDQT